MAQMLHFALADGSEVTVEPGTKGAVLVEGIAPAASRAALAIQVDDQVYELERSLDHDGVLKVLSFEDAKGREVFWHSSTHLMAQALKRLYPETKLAIGPAIQDGFFYDVELPVRLGPEDLPKIEAEMARIVEEDLQIHREVWDRPTAMRYFAERGESYKIEILEALPEDAVISVYRQGEFIDLCRGPHIPSTGRIKAFKLTHVAGAYWRGDESRPMLQRLYGISFEDANELDAYFVRLEEAKRRDHRKLGRDLDLFSMHEEAPGFVFWHPKGMTIYNTLKEYSRQLQQDHGYHEVSTPWMMNVDLWHRSGHWDHYKDNMYFIDKDAEHFAQKPMNCPGAAIIFGSRLRSYRELPLRLADYGNLARYERSGTLHGLMRVRGFTQDDAHIFVTEEQIGAEIADILQLIDDFYAPFGMPYHIKLSTRPDDYMGELSLWDRAEEALAAALKAAGRQYEINPKDGAFYGPKLDFDVTDSLGRQWQCATIQLDFQLARNFDLVYRGPDDKEHHPVVIHRAIMGSLERFIGVLLEHFAGAFPTWLSPVQVEVLPIAARHEHYAVAVVGALQQLGVRAKSDPGNEKLGARIRRCQLEKTPYMLVVGDKEVEQGLVSVRSRAAGDLGQMSAEQFRDKIVLEVASRART